MRERPRDRADARRAAAGGAGRRDPRAGRAGAPLGGGVAGEPRRVQVVATSLVAEHIGPLIEMFAAREEGLEIAVESRAGRRVRRRARAPAGRHRARPAPGPRARGDDRLGAVPALPPDHRRRAGASARRPAGDRAGRARRASAGWSASPSSTRARRPGCSSPATGSTPPTSARTAATPPRSPPPPPARASCSTLGPLRRRGGPAARARPARRARHADRRAVAREHARPRARAARRAGAAALRHDLRRDPGDLDRPRGRGLLRTRARRCT